METVLDVVSWVLILGGSAFCVIGGIGLLRFPDFYCRIHAVGVADTLGSGLILLGLTFQAGASQVTVKLILVLLFLLITGPTAVHALVKAAYSQGVQIDRPHPHQPPANGTHERRA